MPVMVQEFFLLLATCNTVIVARHPHRYSSTAEHYSILVMVQEFFLLLASCNTVIVARHPHR
jgi:predicted small secreted protein